MNITFCKAFQGNHCNFFSQFYHLYYNTYLKMRNFVNLFIEVLCEAFPTFSVLFFTNLSLEYQYCNLNHNFSIGPLLVNIRSKPLCLITITELFNFR